MAFAHQIYKVLWIYSYLTLGLLSGIALVPSYFLVRAAWTLDSLFGLALRGPDVSWGGQLLRGLLVSLSLTYGFFLFGISLMLVFALVRLVMRLRSEEGEIPIPSLKMWTWYHYDGLLLFYSLVFAPFLRSMSLYNVYLRLMGAKVGRNVIVNSNKIYDHDLLEIGDDTIIGGDVIVIAHVAEGHRLVRKRVKIGRNVTIGQYTSVLPGAIIGDNVIVGAHSLVAKDQVLESNAVWGGVPARLLKRLDATA